MTRFGHYHDPLGKYDYCDDPRCPRTARAMFLATFPAGYEPKTDTRTPADLARSSSDQ